MIGVIGAPRRDGQSSFATLIAYCEKDGRGANRSAYAGMRNIHFKESAAEEMASLAFMNPRCKDPLMHIILSWREMELPSNDQIDEAVEIALKELDLQDCQAVWIVHNDTENRHVHIAVNRIDPETHKAIQPAGRWTHRAIQKAARKIELSQGWEIEPNGIYRVAEDGELVEKKGPEPINPKLSKSALDMEAHTAAKSAERIAQETAAPIIRAASSWDELHRALADQGIAFERRGSGATLRIREIIVKASKAGRDISMSKLEARLGEYRPKSDEIQIQTRPAEPIERVAERGAKGEWERYAAARNRYYADKKKAASDVSARQKAERLELQRRQRGEREKLFSVSWKGRGGLLNRTRSVTAARQQAEKLDMWDRHKRELKELKKIFPARYPNFKTWLETEEAVETSISFRYVDNGVIYGIAAETEPAATDIRAFTPSIWNKGGVAYRITGESEAQFIDYGKKIVMAGKCGREAILAALQLANQKWGAAVVNGSDEHKRKCVELAIRHNLRIFNPDLARLVEEGRLAMTQRPRQEGKEIETSMEEDYKYHKKSVFNKYADAVGAERFRVVATEFRESGTQAFLYDRKNGGYEGKTREEILEAIPKFSTYAHYNKNVIVTPMSRDKHHILVDDLTAENLQKLRDDGYKPACVIESSPKNYQAIITVPSVEGDSERDRIAANKITRELNRKYGDPKLSGSVHGHRLPPFPNRKPKHRREDGTYPDTALVGADGGYCEKTQMELEAAHAEIKQAEARAKLDKERTARTPIRGPDPDAAYWAHYRDIAAKFSGTMDYSRVDSMIGIRLRATDHSPEAVRSAIEKNAPAMRRETTGIEEFEAKYRNRDWSRYALETTENYVFGARGAIQFEKALSYRPLYMRIEGRNLQEEDRIRRESERQDKKQDRGM